MSKAINGDLIYASKTLLMSYGTALIDKVVHKRPLLLDIDDWESKGYLGQSTSRAWWGCIRMVRDPDNLPYVLLLEHLTGLADRITVASRFLQRIFGGTLLSHCRDTELFDPSRFDRSIIRSRYGISDRKEVVLFVGTLRPHKGVEDLISGVQRLARRDVLLLVAGIDERDPYAMEVLRKNRKYPFVRFLKQISFLEIPDLLAMADLVVIPQRRTPFSEAQVPAKVFDAMAMGTPVVGTSVSDLPEILDGCGIVVEPGDIGALSEGMAFLLSDREAAERMGKNGRQKCVELYSYDSVRKTFRKLLDELDL
jgi:glycosyltransferase involved in cell wall biosynthesis